MERKIISLLDKLRGPIPWAELERICPVIYEDDRGEYFIYKNEVLEYLPSA